MSNGSRSIATNGSNATIYDSRGTTESLCSGGDQSDRRDPGGGLLPEHGGGHLPGDQPTGRGRGHFLQRHGAFRDRGGHHAAPRTALPTSLLC